MKSSKDRKGAHQGDHFMERFHRAKANFTGSWRCRSGEGDFISPSPRGHGQKKKEKAREKGDYQKVPNDPRSTNVSQPASVKSDAGSDNRLSLEYRPEGDSKKKNSPTNRDKTNRQLQPASQQGQDEFRPKGEKVGNLKERDAASVHTDLPKTDKGKEKVDTELDTVHSTGASLQDVHPEIAEVGDKNEVSSIQRTTEKDLQLTDPLKTGSSKKLDFRGFTPNSEIEEVGQISDTLNSDSDCLRKSQDRKVEEEKQAHHSADGVPEQKVHHGIERSESPHNQYTESKESPAMGKAGQINVPNSESRYSFHEAEGEQVKASEQNESPVSVLSGALGSGRWADFDSGNNTTHPLASTKHEIEELECPSHDRETVFGEISDIPEPGKEIGTPEADSLQNTEESLETPEGKGPHHLVQGGLEQECKAGLLTTPESPKHLDATNSHTTGMDATEKMRSPTDDNLAAFSEQGEAENKTEPHRPLHDITEKESDGADLKPQSSENSEQTSKDGTEHSSQNPTEKSLPEEMDLEVQNREQKLKDSNGADSTRPSLGVAHLEGPSLDHESEALNSDSVQEVEDKQMQDGVNEKQTQDGGVKDPQSDHSPHPGGLEELLTGNSDSNGATNGVHHPYSKVKDVSGSPKLNGIAAAEKDDRASIYGTGEHRSSHLYTECSDYTGLQDSSLEEPVAKLAHQQERAVWKLGFFSVPHVLAAGALTVLTVLGKAASN